MGFMRTAGELRKALDGVPDEATLEVMLLATTADVSVDDDALSEDLALSSPMLSAGEYHPDRNFLRLVLETQIHLGPTILAALALGDVEDGGHVGDEPEPAPAPFLRPAVQAVADYLKSTKPGPGRDG